MARSAPTALLPVRPALADVIELSKPLTWFPPMWAFMCGVVSSGVPITDRVAFLAAGLLLTGPLVCGTSQAINDWFDRDVDRINEPGRPIPSGRIPGRWGLGLAVAGTVAAIGVAALTGPWVLAATVVGLICAWAYSAPPVRLKASGWFGPATVALTYEGLTWFTGAAVMAGARPDTPIIAVLLLYSAGAFGIMTLNDFKAVEGDALTGVRSLPVRLGPQRAARLACLAMALPQAAVVLLLARWDLTASAIAVAASLVLQTGLMLRLLRDPRRHAPWYNATGTTLYVLGMLAAAIGLGAGR
jgi:chlorophyll/bacteriochlorophyll a synthase